MIHLHGIAGSRSFRTLWLLQEMGLDCDYTGYSITDGSLRTPEFLALSPAGRVPALEIDGRVLFESGAICEYLCETRPEHGLAPMPGAPGRMEFLEWVHYSETMGHLLANLNLQHIFLRDPAMRSPTLMKLDTARLANTLKPLEKLLSSQDWLLGDAFSAADTMMGFVFDEAAHFVRFDAFPALTAYAARMAARPAYVRAQEIEGPNQFYTQDFYEVPDA